jgi:thioredoxin-like negative regulator of GroEL
MDVPFDPTAAVGGLRLRLQQCGGGRPCGMFLSERHLLNNRAGLPVRMARTQLSTSLNREKPGVEITHRRAEGIFLKLSLGGLFGFVLLVALIWGGHRFYVRWQEKRLIHKAESAMQQGDTATASLAARAVLQLKPDSAPAARIAATIAERARDSSALTWRRKVAQAKNHSGEDVLALARTALQFNDVITAKSALAGLPETEWQTAGFHVVAALIAQAEKQNDKAAGEWQEAVRLAPQEKAYQLQLGAAQLRSNDSARRKAGAGILSGLRSDDKHRTAATRILINEGVATHQQSVDTILQLAHDLGSYPDATFTDRILLADLLRQANDPQFASYLTELEKSAIARPEDLAALLSWMSGANLNLLAVDFIRTLKPELLQPWPVPLVMADINVRLKDWTKLEAATKFQDWRSFDFLRHAYLARASREQNKLAAAQSEWSTAAKGASAGSEQSMMLLRTAAAWGWENEQLDLLWTLAKHPEKEKEALQSLYRYYQKNRDTHGLYRVLIRLAEQHPDNLDVQNNLAQVSLLLEAKTEDARRIAAEVYHKHPDNPAYATTYAYALLTKGDKKGAANVMGSLTKEQLKDPAVGAYYGICLAALNDPRAREFLEAAKGALLLPEEKSLLEKARAQLDAH